jgi:DNA repair photolyase
MFHFINKKVNPVTGCPHGCVYCWARRLAEGKLKDVPRYQKGFISTFNEKELSKKFKKGDFVFIGDMGDTFASTIPNGWIEKVLTIPKNNPEAKFLFLTKNPVRYFDFDFPDNCVLGATIETNRFYENISKAPKTLERYLYLRDLRYPYKFVSIEPIMKFDLEEFLKWIIEIKPELVAIGYDNYSSHLPEPSLAETNDLIIKLRMNRINIITKTIRQAWDHETITNSLRLGV